MEFFYLFNFIQLIRNAAMVEKMNSVFFLVARRKILLSWCNCLQFECNRKKSNIIIHEKPSSWMDLKKNSRKMTTNILSSSFLQCFLLVIKNILFMQNNNEEKCEIFFVPLPVYLSKIREKDSLNDLEGRNNPS